MNIQQCLDYLDEKKIVLNFILGGLGKTGLTTGDLKWLTLKMIKENYNYESI